MRLADYLISALHDAGIDHAFAVSGGGVIFLDDAIAVSNMKYVACHHEQSAAMAAEAYARVRGLGLAVVTSGPGGTNAITGVVGAWTDHVPTVTLSGQAFSGQMIGNSGLRTLGVQEINIIDLVRPVTKYAAIVTEKDSIRYHLEKALYLAKSGRPGPVWLDIPVDIQKAEINPDDLSGFEPDEGEAPVPNIGAVLGLLRKASRPLLHVGQGVRLAGAERKLLAFAQVAGIPIVTARAGNDLIDSGHELYVGRPGTFAQRGANFAVQTCDVYLAIGTRLGLAQTGYNAKDYARKAKVVMVDIDRSELDKDTVPIYLKIQADAGAFLDALTDASRNVVWPDWSNWLERCKAWQTRYPVVLPEYRESKLVNSYVLVETLSDICLPTDVIVTDVGYAYQCTSQAWKVKQGQRVLSNNGTAAMGWGLPAAVGAAIGSSRRTVLLAGDGGLMMNLQELSTIRHHNLPVKIFLLNNGGYLTQSKAQEFAFGRVMGSGKESLSFPDFQMVADAFGIPAVKIESQQNLESHLKSVLRWEGPVVCEIVMDASQEQAPRALNRRLPDGSMQPTALEDAFPFLDPKEIQENLAV